MGGRTLGTLRGAGVPLRSEKRQPLSRLCQTSLPGLLKVPSVRDRKPEKETTARSKEGSVLG